MADAYNINAKLINYIMMNYNKAMFMFYWFDLNRIFGGGRDGVRIAPNFCWALLEWTLTISTQSTSYQ